MVNSEKLQVFKIAGNYLNDPLASLALSKAIRGFKYLSILSCGDACIGNYGIKKLLSSLDGSEYLLRIELEYNEVDQNDIGDDILKLLHTKKNLEVRIKQVINISGFDLSPEMIDRIKIASSKYDKFVEVILVDAHESSYEDLPILDENESIIAGFLYEDLN